MTTIASKNMFLIAASALICLGYGPLDAGVRKNIENVKHALGWDTINLKTIEKDAALRPTLERENNLANRVERKTSYHANGKKKSQSVTVISKTGGKILYESKNEWDDSGTIQASYVQDDAYNANGRQTKGQIVEKKYQGERLSSEVKKKFSPATGDWAVTYKQAISYYEDGDLKERVTENPQTGDKERETWSEKQGALGRKESKKKWNASIKQWE